MEIDPLPVAGNRHLRRRIAVGFGQWTTLEAIWLWFFVFPALSNL